MPVSLKLYDLSDFLNICLSTPAGVRKCKAARVKSGVVRWLALPTGLKTSAFMWCVPSAAEESEQGICYIVIDDAFL